MLSKDKRFLIDKETGKNFISSNSKGILMEVREGKKKIMPKKLDDTKANK